MSDVSICPWCRKKVTRRTTILGNKVTRHCGKDFYFNSVGILTEVLETKGKGTVKKDE